MRPLMNAVRPAVQLAWPYQLVKCAPSLAMRSMFGVGSPRSAPPPEISPKSLHPTSSVIFKRSLSVQLEFLHFSKSPQSPANVLSFLCFIIVVSLRFEYFGFNKKAMKGTENCLSVDSVCSCSTSVSRRWLSERSAKFPAPDQG